MLMLPLMSPLSLLLLLLLLRLNQATLALLALLFLFNELLHPVLFWSPSLNTLRLPFLPLLLYSSVCAVVLSHAYILMVGAACCFELSALLLYMN
jgi:hypothetical protein